jgi:N-formylmaleamate deformylase
MSEYQQGDVKVNGVKIHYYRSKNAGRAKKQTIILLHGATDDARCWGKTADHLAERYDVIMVDALGHGYSDRLDSAFSYNSHTELTAGLVKALGIVKPIIMGHSMGAGTTSAIAVEYPDLPKAIILEDPGWNIAPRPGATAGGTPTNHAQIKAYQTGVAKMPIEEIKAECRKTNPTWPEYEVETWAASRKLWDTNLFDRMVLNPMPYEEVVTKIQCPTLLIIAEKGIVSQAAAEKAAKLWKSKSPFRWVYIKGAGHSIRRENYPDYIKAVDAFLQELE